MKIAVAGTGYVGLVTGVCLASKGHQVTCVDVDEKKIEIMRQGIAPIYEAGLEELMRSSMDCLTFTTDYQMAYKDAEVIFIGVGTPEKKDGSANLTYVYAVAKQIAQTIIETAKANGLNVYTYLEFLLMCMPDTDWRNHPEDLEDLMPWSQMAQEICKR